MNRTPLLVAIVLLIILAGGFLAYQSMGPNLLNQLNPTPTPAPIQEMIIPNDQLESSPSSLENDQVDAVIVEITSTGFSPEMVNIQKGQTVTWINNDTKAHNVNSDPHPQHTNDPELNEISRLEAGSQKSLTFPEAGTFNYHDHLFPSFTGRVIVE